MMNHYRLNFEGEREEAYLYDLYVTPQWCELFNQLIDAEVKLPKQGKILDAGCGTGGLAINLAASLGPISEIVGIDSSEERLVIARAKAGIKKLDQLTFQVGSLTALGLPADEFDLVIGDASLIPTKDLAAAFVELRRVAKPGAALVLTVATRGSFDEFFSIFWQGLHELDLIRYTAALEAIITERLTSFECERLAGKAGWRHVRSVTRKERFDYGSAEAFLSEPMLERYFFPDWFAILPDNPTRELLRQRLVQIINRERCEIDFDISIKATIIVGRK